MHPTLWPWEVIHFSVCVHKLNIVHHLVQVKMLGITQFSLSLSLSLSPPPPFLPPSLLLT